jgi:hypothetical protein
MARPKPNPFRYFNSSPEVSRLAVMLYVRYPLSLRNVGDLLHERGIDICHETVRFWWNRFGPLFAGDIRKKRVRPGNGTVKLTGAIARRGGYGVNLPHAASGAAAISALVENAWVPVARYTLAESWLRGKWKRLAT